MNMIRHLSILTALFALLLLCACKRSEDASPQHSAHQPYRVAVLVVSDMYLPLSVEGLKQGMESLGYKEGRDVEYAVYNARGDRTKLESLAREAIANKPNVICPSTITAIDAVRVAETKIPVVFLESMYPVEFGVVQSLTRPGGNYTGVSNMTGPMSGKRLELLQRICPSVRKVGVLCNPDNKVSTLAMETTRKAASELGIDLKVFSFSTVEEMDQAIARLAASDIDALTLNPDYMVFSRLPQLIDLALKKKIPSMGIDSTQVQQGVLASYGGGLREIAAQAARHVDRVLRDESPATIPIEAPVNYQLFLNIKTAERIGLKLPKEILYQAERFYQ